MSLPPQLEAFWQEYLATRGDLPPLDYDPIWQFGNLEVAGRVGQLVNAGIKTATSSLLWHLEQIGEPVPQVGASDYGEYGRTLEQWRVASWAYFSEVYATIGREPSETTPMICQRFRRVYP